jgi:serine protease inhibitor
MSRLTRVLVLAGVVTLATAQGSVTGQANHLLAAETGKAPVNYAVTANSDFAVDLYRQLAKENPGKNLFFSPYSMSSALAMTAEGARGETADQMGKVLGFPQAARHIGDDAQRLPWNTALIHTGTATLNERFQTKPAPQELRDQLAAARKELEASQAKEKVFQSAKKWQESRQQRDTSGKLAEKVRELSSQVDPYEIRVANALYGEKTYPFRQEFVNTINKFYGTGAVVPVDFIHNFEAVRQQINTWVEQQTKERIKDLLAKGSLDPMTRLVLVNAIYFKGDWAVPFDEKATKQEDFLAGAAQIVSVPMMRKDKLEGGRYGAFNADGSLFATPKRVSVRPKPEAATLYPGKEGFLVAELPYKGKELSMVLLVPQDAEALGALEQKLTSANLQTWLGKLEGREMNVQMPKFKLETDYPETKNTLQAMGMRRAFEQDAANFDGMCASSKADLYISKVCHKAFVEVTEKGTEAAAATAVVMTKRGAPVDVPFTPTVRADRPFLFAIRDVPTGTILFLGRMVAPAGTGAK